MPGAKESPTLIRFGPFEADLQSQEIKKHGIRLRLSPQSFQILQVLLERPGELVSREQLRQILWPSDTFVDFEHGLNAAMNRLRECLGDDADKPHYVETLPRRGYRFIAAVEGTSTPALERNGQPSAQATSQPSQLSGSAVIATAKQHRWATAAARGLAALVVLGAAALGGYSLLHRAAPTPFQKFTLTQITHSGKAMRAAISPDGRYVVSVTDDGMESLWVGNVATGSDTQIIPPSASHYESLTFSPDGNYIYFRKTQAEHEPCCNLYRVPMLGGAPQLFVENIDSDVAFSPDGQRIAYIRGNVPEADKYSILTASLEGEHETVVRIGPLITEKVLPYLAWSSKSNEIAHSLYSPEQEGGRVGAIDTVSTVAGGKSRRFVAFKDKFPEEIRWSPDGQTLFTNYRQTGANWSRTQIGFLSGPGTSIEPITRDTNRYETLTLSADGRTLATVQTRSYSTVYVLSKAGHGFRELRPLLSQSGEFDEWSQLNWSPDGNLLVSNTGRLFKLTTDGKNRTDLLADSGALIVHPAPCGSNYLVLTWTFHGGGDAPSIWRTNADGSSPVKLTDGKYDFYPVCSPDQKWVYYIDFTDGQIYRMPLSGSGKAEPVLPRYGGVGNLSVSPDGKKLAAAVATGIALFELGSSNPPRMLDASHYAVDMYGNSTLHFTPDGKSIAFVRRDNGADNVWVQPLDGSAGHAVTDFKSEQIWSFSLSPDGKNLAVLRGHYDSDVVLLQESTR